MATVPERPKVGGALSLDLLNTTWQTAAGPYDWLSDDRAVAAFSEEHGAGGSDDVVATRQALRSARDLVRRLIAEGTTGEISPDLAAEVQALLAQAEVRFMSDGPRIELVGQESDRVAVAAVLDAVELLSGKPGRLRVCGHEQCTLHFVDTSKAGRRRWCSMETCGNRAKAKRHYEKSTELAREQSNGE